MRSAPSIKKTKLVEGLFHVAYYRLRGKIKKKELIMNMSMKINARGPLTASNVAPLNP